MDAALARARELVMAFGWNATAYQIINPGIAHWFSARGDAVVGYVPRHGVRVVAGAPVCARDRLASVVAEFDAHARAAGARVCYFGAGERLEALYGSDRAHSVIGLGAQPSWDPNGWPAIIHRHASLRAQLHRAHNKGVAVVPWPAERAQRDPALRRCLDEWLATRGLPPLHFLVEPETLARLYDRRIFVAERDGVPVGFLVASPVPARNGWLFEQIIRGRGAPNGTSELLIDAAMRAVAASGATYATLGLAPLSHHSHFDSLPNPLWIRLGLRWLRAHGRRFYNFEGLDAFKSKLDPHAWEEIRAISYGATFPLRSLYAIAAAFSGRSPIALLSAALWRAARQEGRWLGARWRRQPPPRR
jgi:phosphatidylglycerol lysyltransferase